MHNITRQPTQRFRLWLLATVAILLLVSILEAGHVHGVFTQIDDSCTLCQHSVGLDKAVIINAHLITPLLLAILVSSIAIVSTPTPSYYFAPIRAPPVKLPRH